MEAGKFKNIVLCSLLAVIVFTGLDSKAAPGKFCKKAAAKIISDDFRERASFYNPFAIFKYRSIDAIDLLSEDFYLPAERGVVVGVSGMTGMRANFNRANQEFLRGKFYSDNTHTFNEEVNDVLSFFMYLHNIYDRHGPIQKLAIVAHGNKGHIKFGQELLNEKWILKHQDFLRTLSKDLFTIDAEVVLLACNCVQGNILAPDSGAIAIRNIFQSFIHKGANVYASRKRVSINTEGFPDTPLVEMVRMQNHLDKNTRQANLKMIPLGIAMIPTLWGLKIKNMIWLDEKSKFEPIAVIEIPAKQD